jgi:hypothetical protein
MSSLCLRAIAQEQGNFNGIFNSYNHFEKVLHIPSFQNEVSNLAVDITIGNISFWGSIEIEITGSYAYQNTPGKISKLFAVGVNPNNSIYTNESRVTEAIGAVVDNISIGDFKWDVANSRYSIPISHTTSTMNDYTVKVKLLSHGYGALYASQYLSVSSAYPLAALPRNQVHVLSNFGIGTATPVSQLHVYNSANTASVSIQSGVAHSILNLQSANANQYSYINLGNGSTYGWQIGKDIDAGGIAGANGFYVYELTEGQHATRFAINKGGNIGIGTINPAEKLSVNGNVRAKKVIVSQSGWPDYVFDSSYSLKPLNELKSFIAKHKHLPEIPSAKEVKEQGISLGDGQALLLKKIEELTLYILQLENRIKKMERSKNQK